MGDKRQRMRVQGSWAKSAQLPKGTYKTETRLIWCFFKKPAYKYMKVSQCLLKCSYVYLPVGGARGRGEDSVPCQPRAACWGTGSQAFEFHQPTKVIGAVARKLDVAWWAG